MKAAVRLVALAFLVSLPLLAAAAPARAQDGDTVYGRLGAWVTMSAEAGGGVALGDPAGDPRGALEVALRARILDSAGLVLAGQWRPDARSRVIVAADLRPVFLARFLLNAESGAQWLDLFVDSICLELGVALLPLDESVGAALALGLGLDIPLWLPSRGSEGIFVHLGFRHVYADAADERGPTSGASDSTFLAALGVRWSVGDTTRTY